MKANKWVKRVMQVAMVAVFGSSLLWRCANQTALQGGPKDSLPPIVVSALPAFNTTNFTGREIFIGFDEYVQIKDQQKEFFTSPMMKKNPTITTSGRGIRITILDTLEENQTYALNFGRSIVDNNEGNPLSNFRYVFSTGSTIDSMVMSGYTVSASKGDSVSNSLIFFYPAEVDSIPDYDSILLKYKPAVVAKAGGNGIFIAQNLKPIDYKIYAIEDKNNNFTYDPETDMVGFLDSVHNPLNGPDFRVWYDTTRHYLTAEPQLYFKMFTDGRFKRQNLAESKRDEQHKVTLYFGAPNPEVLEFRLDSIAPEEVVTEYLTRGKDTINYWLNVPSERLGDTLRGHVVYLKHDSINNLVPDTAKLSLVWKYIESKEEKKAREEEERKMEEALKDSVEYVPPVKPNPFKVEQSKGDLNPEQTITFTFKMPLVAVDTAAIDLRFAGDALSKEEEQKIAEEKAKEAKKRGLETLPEDNSELPKMEYELFRDSLDMKKWHLRAAWEPKKKYSLMVPAGAFVNVAGESNDTLRSDHITLNPDEFGKVIVRVVGKNPESRYVIYLKDERGSNLAEIKDATSGTYTFNYVKPGKVRLGFLEDVNGNGRWDTGNLIERRQPERTEPYVDDKGEEMMEVKANWEMEIAADMNEIFKPITFESVNEQLRKTEAVRLRKILEDREKKRQEELKKQQQGGGLGGFSSGMGAMKGAMNSIGGSGASGMNRY
ncbi:MAG: Ig-like domain-containing protein [Tidjanibacter sp.]|nr:Ig-like domain-containing protein [Tidjanibacter sp.]